MDQTNSVKRAPAWLSQGVEHLFSTLKEEGEPAIDVDVLIVGSGYGGAVAAAGLAGSSKDGKPVTVWVLERGKEYLPGSFPGRMSELAGHVRVSMPNGAAPSGEREGLFDVRVGGDVSALVANGLGGGSLINAGVMVRPRGAPLKLLAGLVGDLEPYFVRALDALGAQVGGEANTIEKHAGPPPAKYEALRKMAGRLPPGDGVFSPAPITVAMRERASAAGVGLSACAMCGDCATGCNLNAKESLDTNLLYKAWKQGAKLYTGATVLRIERDARLGGWCVHVNYTDAKLRARRDLPYKIRARKLILAAGTFGSTEILLRSQSDELSFSSTIGRKFSSNGDMIAIAYDGPDPVDGVADEAKPPREREVGPTITGMVDLPGKPGEPSDLLIEDMAVPGPLRRLFEEMASTANTLHELGRLDASVHTGLPDERDPCAVDRDRLGRSALLAVMGDDGAGGWLELVGGKDDDSGDGAIRVRWPALRDHWLFPHQVRALGGATDSGNPGPGPNGTILPNPLWKLLPESMEFLLSNRRGPLLTVHPLGGCAIGASVGKGVVNDCGEVFRALTGDDDTVHDGLMVLDGAILPGALGVNPALTITALALRAIDKLKRKWDWDTPPAATPAAAPLPVTRPRFRAEQEPETPRPTTAQFIERMSGPATLVDRHGVKLHCMIELSLHFSAIDLASLVLPKAGQAVPIKRALQVDAAASKLELFDANQWDEWKLRREVPGETPPPPLLKAAVAGTLHFFHREASTPKQRRSNSLLPWLLNRGLRDLWQWGAERWSQGGLSFTRETARQLQGELRMRYDNAMALASHAGEVRLFEYAIDIGASDVAGSRLDANKFSGQRILGTKRFTYARASNPWNQLMRMEVDSFPCLRAGTRPELELDTNFLVRENVALFRILGQQDQPAALADVVSLGAYLLRLLLSIHVWSLRKPDATPMRVPARLPGIIPGLPRPEITELEVDQLPDGTPVHVRLTRYRCDERHLDRPPVVMIHGYSASGTTFAHPAVRPNLASYLWKRKRDVWIVDLRTSSGMPHARHPWTFEDAAHADIPAAIAHVCRVAGDDVDVIAHCMGAAMISMAILAEPRAGERFAAERLAMNGNIRRLVLSQVGPLVVFSQANIFRAYLLGFLRQLLPLRGFAFRVEGEPSLMDELIDRLLATTPYPMEEFHLENPWWPWGKADFVRTRHRMDALYGRDFSLCNVDRPVLDHIDDFFGPLSTDTVSQAMHFARLKTITNRAGRNVYVSREDIKKRWIFDTMSVHGMDNGLSDPATLGRMDAMFKDTFFAYVTRPMEGFGHQDCFIGRDAHKVFAAVEAFLGPGTTSLADYKMSESAGPDRWSLRTPWSGPVRTSLDTPSGFQVGAGSDPAYTRAVLVAFIPVTTDGEHYRIWSDTPGMASRQALVRGLQLYSGAGDENGWMQFAPTPPSATASGGPDGLLMLLFYDEKPTFFDNRASPQFHHPSLRGRELMGLLRDRRAMAAPPILPGNPLALAAILAELLDFVDKIFDDIARSIERELAASLAERLAPGLVSFGTGAAGRDSSRLCFAMGSCQYPAGLLDQGPAFASFRRLAGRLDDDDGTGPAFLLLLGDQIYSDATAGLFDPSALDDRYVRPYEKLFANRHVKSVMRRLPTFMMLDDHEIMDNWEPLAHARQVDPNLTAGRSGYLRFQRTNALVPSLGTAQAPHVLETGTPLHGFPFFIADTRTERTARSASMAGCASIMSERQFKLLLAWLLAQHEADADRPKFIASPSILVPRRLRATHGGPGAHCLRSDAWDGYPASMQRLLAHIGGHGIGNVVFLSGDEHLSCEATLLIQPPGTKPAVTVRSFHSSALYAPYPFANSIPEDLADSGETFSFADPAGAFPGQFGCTVVEVTYAKGDGFALVTAEQRAGRWKIDCAFDRAPP
ncbi:alkaline phosphatase D family protein [Massilia pseudoviolaceinigra]|uniref:alkaline phosphatase D family protein n=1 Tax=Massilia pseudoviolaceinigra TaxID=3057165 RepID=UPI00279663C9|nr:alkaline phosphatase D family protein [Massilia sp. CCM 9206]MDQ1919285.1 alkaline phosphatase D family protein [Massilia sp. CCM 9206]